MKLLNITLLVLCSTTGLACVKNYAGQCSVVVDFDCATAEALSSAVSEHMARGLPIISGHATGQFLAGRWSDRAIRVDLVEDDRPEFLIPTECGATGNCFWLIYSDPPPRALGAIEGALLCISRKQGGSSKLTTYLTEGAGEGTIQVNVFQHGSFVLKSSKKLYGAENESFLLETGDPVCTLAE